jgi:hypothetical protein
MTALRDLGASPPYAVLITLIGEKGSELAARGNEFETYTFDRSVVPLSELIFSEPAGTLTTDQQAATFMRPAFDEIHNAAGRFGSGNFDNSGNWNPNR